VEGLISFLPFAVILLAFWLLILRPQRARMRAVQEVQDALQVGSQVITTAGLYGTVAALDEESVTLEVAPGVTNKYVRAAVGRVVTPTPEAGGSPAAGSAGSTPVRPAAPAPGDSTPAT